MKLEEYIGKPQSISKTYKKTHWKINWNDLPSEYLAQKYGESEFLVKVNGKSVILLGKEIALDRDRNIRIVSKLK